MKIHLFRIIALVFGIVLSMNGFAQTTKQSTTSQNPFEAKFDPMEKCGSMMLHETLMKNDPVYRQRQLELETVTRDYVPEKSGGQYRVPVVVHVVYHTTDALGVKVQNITDIQIQQAIQNLNERFRNISGTGVDLDIEFSLAVVDPSGACTNGITRHDASTALAAADYTTYKADGINSGSGFGITDPKIKAVNPWTQTQYFNIWLVTEFDGNNAGNGTQGYAALAGAHGTSTDGAVMSATDFILSTSTTGTHELGHSFNLYHTFQGDDADNNSVADRCPNDSGTLGTATSQSDGCADTPLHQRSVSDCDFTGTTCSGVSKSLHVYNYMDYSNCPDRFTNNQFTRINAAMTTTRKSFLAAQGNVKLVPVTTCYPTAAAFRSDKTILCAGDNIRFYDQTSAIPNDFLDQVNPWPNLTFAWTIDNGAGNVYTSPRQNPTFPAPAAGTYSVTLTVTNTALSKTATITTGSYFKVAPSPTAAACASPNPGTVGNLTSTVSNVTMNTINNSTLTYLNGGYQNLVCTKNTMLTAGTTYPLTLTVNAGGSGREYAQVDIDWNNDGDFLDAGENGATSTPVRTASTSASNMTITPTFNVLVPATATKNVLLRMRVMADLFGAPPASSCGTSYTAGDIEDYGLYVRSSGFPPTVISGPSNSAAICENLNTTFTATFGGTVDTYSWEVSTDGGTTWTPVADNATYSNSATTALTVSGVTPAMSGYKYRATATNVDGSITTAGATLTVTPVPATAVLTPPGTVSFCTSGTLTSDITTNIELYKGGAPTGITSSPFTISTFGSYTVVHTVSGCSSTSLATVVNINTNVIAVGGGGNDPTTCGGADGAIEITGSGTGTLTYTVGAVSTPLTAITLPYIITGLTAGSYDISFVDGNTCTSNTVTKVLADPGAPVAPVLTAGSTTTFCAGGSVVLTSDVTTGIELYKDGVATGSTTSPFTINGTGTHTYTVKLTSGSCTALSNAIVVTINDNPVIAVTGNNPVSCGGAGSIDVSSLSGSTTGDLSWTGTASGTNMAVTLPSSVTGLLAGTYNVLLTDGNGCTSNSANAVLSDPGSPAKPTVTNGGPLTFCAGGSVTLTGSALPTGTATYLWSTAETTQSIVASTAPGGTYTLQIVDGGCTSPASDPVVVTINALPVAPNVTAGSTTTFCAGGSVVLTSDITTGIELFMDGSGTGSTTSPFTVSGSGTHDYTVKVTDVNGCSSTSAITTVTVNANPVIAALGNDPSTCGAMGSIDVTSVSGAATGDLAWTGTAGGTTVGATLPTSIPGLLAGNYNVTLTDGNGCTSPVVNVVLTDLGSPAKPTVTNGGPVTFCAGGSVTLTGSALPTGTATYLWSTGETTQSIVASTAPGGTYTLQIVDGTCTSPASDPVVVTINALPVAPNVTAGSTTTFCAGGSVVLTSDVTTGIELFMDGSGTGSTTSPFTVSGSGTHDYTVKVTDVNGCSATSAITTVTVNALPQIAATGNNPVTCGAMGSIDVTSVSGATTGDLAWTGTAGGINVGVTLPTSITGLLAGPYSVTLTDGNGCISTAANVVLADPGSPAKPTVTNGGPVTFCAGGNVTLTGSALPTGTATYLWSTTDVTSSVFVTTSGKYTLKIVDGGCTSPASDTVFVIVNPLPTAPNVTPAGPITFCAGGNAVLTSDITTGIELYKDGAATGSVTNPFTVTAAGTYDVRVTDVNGCSATSNAVIVNVSSPVIAIGANTNTSVCAAADGTIEVTGPAGTGTVAWNGTYPNLAGVSTTLPYTITGATGAYDITFTDASGCISNSVTGVINDPGGPAKPTISASGPLTFCSGGNVILTSSGTGVDYKWNTGDLTASTSPITASGVFSVVITDQVSNCSTVSDEVFVTVNLTPAKPTIIAGGPLSFCNGGSVSLTSNSVPAVGPTATYLWSDLETTPSITATLDNDYTVTVIENGCTSPTSDPTHVTVFPVTTLSAGTVIQPVSCASPAIDGSIQVNGSGTGNALMGTLSYTVSAITTTLPGTTTLPFPITGLAPGTYDINFVTVDGCNATNTLTVTLTDVPAPLTPIITYTGAAAICVGTNITLTASTGTNIEWFKDLVTTGVTTNPYTETPSVAGTFSYVVVADNGFGCKVPSGTTTINVTDVPVITLGTVINPVACGSATGSIEVNPGGTTTGSGTLSWTGGTPITVTFPGTAMIPSLTAGTYTITFTQACVSNTLTTTLVDAAAAVTPIVTTDGPTTFCVNDNVTFTSSVTTGIEWQVGPIGGTLVGTGVTSSTFPFSPPVGGYTVVAKNTSGTCTSSSTGIDVIVNPPITPVISATTPLCVGNPLQLTCNPIANATYSWITTAPAGFTSPLQSPLVTPNATTANGGTYTIYVTAGGCIGTASVTVIVRALPNVTFSAIPNKCANNDPIALSPFVNPQGGVFSGVGVTPNGQQFNPAGHLGTNTITYSYSDGFCTKTATSQVTVGPCTGLDENTASVISIFPNPSTGAVKIDAGDILVKEVAVYDNLGKLIQFIPTVNASLVELDLNTVAEGMYTIQVSTENKIERSQLVIKR